jgi:hypothetical protein
MRQSVHVVSVNESHEEADRRAVDFLTLHDVQAYPAPVASSAAPADIVPEQVRYREARLLVMGASGGSLLGNFLFGSGTRALLKECPVAGRHGPHPGPGGRATPGLGPGRWADIGRRLNPLPNEIFARSPTPYYCSVEPSEWASDRLCRRRTDREQLYPRLIRHATTTYGAADVRRFLGRRLTADGQVPSRFSGEQRSHVQGRAAGVRLKHGLNHPSLKLYDKGAVRRAEGTITEPTDFQVYRANRSSRSSPKACNAA